MYVPPFGEVRIPFQPNCGVDLLLKSWLVDTDPFVLVWLNSKEETLGVN